MFNEKIIETKKGKKITIIGANGKIYKDIMQKDKEFKKFYKEFKKYLFKQLEPMVDKNLNLDFVKIRMDKGVSSSNETEFWNLISFKQLDQYNKLFHNASTGAVDEHNRVNIYCDMFYAQWVGFSISDPNLKLDDFFESEFNDLMSHELTHVDQTNGDILGNILKKVSEGLSRQSNTKMDLLDKERDLEIDKVSWDYLKIDEINRRYNRIIQKTANKDGILDIMKAIMRQAYTLHFYRLPSEGFATLYGQLVSNKINTSNFNHNHIVSEYDKLKNSDFFGSSFTILSDMVPLIKNKELSWAELNEKFMIHFKPHLAKIETERYRRNVYELGAHVAKVIVYAKWEEEDQDVKEIVKELSNYSPYKFVKAYEKYWNEFFEGKPLISATSNDGILYDHKRTLNVLNAFFKGKSWNEIRKITKH